MKRLLFLSLLVVGCSQPPPDAIDCWETGETREAEACVEAGGVEVCDEWEESETVCKETRYTYNSIWRKIE